MTPFINIAVCDWCQQTSCHQQSFEVAPYNLREFYYTLTVAHQDNLWPSQKNCAITILVPMKNLTDGLECKPHNLARHISYILLLVSIQMFGFHQTESWKLHSISHKFYPRDFLNWFTRIVLIDRLEMLCQLVCHFLIF